MRRRRRKRELLRIKLKSYDHKLVDLSSRRIVETVMATGAKVKGPVPLPVKREIYCVLRSPHVDKRSGEHFEIRTHKRLIDIYDANERTMEELKRLELPPGVDIEIKFIA